MRNRPLLAALIAAVALLATGCASSRKVSFTGPEQAVDSLIVALRSGDLDRARAILGAAGDEILSSGDPVADRNNLETFLAAYDEQHRIAAGPDGEMTLLVGRTEWPMPIPIVSDELRWYFDSDAGLDEILTRRIGRDELDAIQVCLAIVDAQREYAEGDFDGDGLQEYAQKFVSDPGKKDGLYWSTGEGEPMSPLGPFAAEAAEEGYTRSASGEPRPYHGYIYRMLKSQGAAAPGGAFDYVVNGKMLGGFAVVAYPVDYGNSGIVTFLVSHAGVVYERDLGTDTARLAKSMTAFDPGPEWKRAE